MTKTMYRALSLICTFILIISCMVSPFSINASVRHNSNTVIKVGYVPYSGLIQESKNKELSGYGYDYLKEISKYTGWQYEFIPYKFPDLVESVKNGTIDIIFAQWSEELKEELEYSEYSIGMTYSFLYTSPDNDDVFYNDFNNFSGMKIGSVNNSYADEKLILSSKRNNYNYIPHFYTNNEEIFSALENNEIDAAAVGSISEVNKYKLISNLSADPMYFAFKKENTMIKGSFDSIIAQIKSKKPTFEAELFKKYFYKGKITTIPAFTREEKEFIDSSDIIKVGLLSSRPPWSEYDKKNKQFTGIDIAIINKISEISGLNFDVSALPHSARPIDYIKSKNADIVVGVLQNEKFENDNDVYITEPYINKDMIVVGRKGQLFNSTSNATVAIPVSFEYLEDYITNHYPDFKIIYENDTAGCLFNILKGKADYVIQDSLVINYYFQNPVFDDLEIIPTVTVPENICLALSSRLDPTVISIINKSLAVFNDEIIDQIIMEQTVNRPYRAGFFKIIYKYRYFVSLLLLFIILISIMIVKIIITRKKYADALMKKNCDLEIAIKNAECASKAKSNFLSRMSHEIRTPMNAIFGFAEIADKNLDNKEKIHDCLNKITVSSKILLGIINDILDMSAIENNKIKIAEEKFDLKETIQSTSIIYHEQAVNKNIEFNVLIFEILHEILIGDQLRLNQIMMNLTSNAIKFTPSGGKIDVIIRQRPQDEHILFLDITIKDTGEGMSEDMLKHIFQPFEQEDGTTARKHGGSGLGLSITKNLVDLMNGTIKVKSIKNIGTEFKVSIPFKYEKLIPNEMKALYGKNIIVLFCDENLICCMPEHSDLLNINITYSTSYDDCIEKIKKNNYDICIINGDDDTRDYIDICSNIRREQYSNDLKIIIISYELSRFKKNFSALSADFLISKPVFLSDINEAASEIDDPKIYNKKESGSDKYDFSGRRIILAEDNAINRELATELLSMSGITVDCADNGIEALKLFENSPPETYACIIMDIQMPEMDGYETSEKIRKSAHSQSKTIPIIAMSADAFYEDIKHSLRSGMNDHISKPINSDILFKTLKKYI